MHEPRLHPQSPKRRRAQLVSRMRRTALHDAITRSEIMQQVITIRMNDLVTKGLRNGEHAAVDNGTCGRSHNRRHVARSAANSPKNSLPSLHVAGCGQYRIPRRHFRAPDELREMVDVGKA